MTEKTLEKHTELITTVNSWLEAHREYRAMYDKKMAFDFDFFRFFKPGENKISEILAYFLDPKRNHGQEDAFLKIFVKSIENIFPDVSLNEEDTLKSIKCEYGIENQRRIDILLRFESGFLLAIENKIWAKDQEDQLNDYAKHLQSHGKDFLLVYLSPYGRKPSEESISVEEYSTLKGDKIVLMSYYRHFLEIVDKWIGACEAENVAYFLRQFKKHLRVKFLGSEPVLKTKKMEELVYNNQVEVNELKKVFDENEERTDKIIMSIFNKIKNDSAFKKNYIYTQQFEFDHEETNLKVNTVRMNFKYNDNVAYLRVFRRGLDILINYNIDNSSEEWFVNQMQSLNLEKEFQFPVKTTEDEILRKFKGQIDVAIQFFESLK